jgi:MoxR-like ATPase
VETSKISSEQAAFESLQAGRQRLETELGKVIIGQRDVVEQLLLAMIAGGHCLITGAPGLAKTLLVKTIASAFQLQFQRIQFTPDLMPADITGTEILTESESGRKLTFIKGPIFGNLILADEINRTPPKTQAALLEAMQEHQVTAAGVRHALSEPFFVLATQNPVEMEGTYPLPEAQLDRFLFNVLIDYLPENDEVAVVQQTTSRAAQAVQGVFSGEDVVKFQELVRRVPVAEDVVRYAVKLTASSRPKAAGAPDFVKNWINWGAGTRAAQALVIGAKARVLWRGATHVTGDDIRALAAPVFRHRLLLNYRAEADGVSVEQVIQKLVEALPKSV